MMRFEHMLRTWIAQKAAEDRVRSAVPTLRQHQFERQILEHPHEDGPMLVYADWLTERGDPRGEYIACAIVGRTDPRVFGRADRLRHDFEPGWLWPLGAPEDTFRLDVVWQNGFLSSARLWTLEPVRGVSGHLLRLVNLPVALKLTKLAIELGPAGIVAGNAAAGLAACRRIRTLELEVPGMDARDVAPLAELDALRELSIDVAGLEPGALWPLLERTLPLDRLELDRVIWADELVDRLVAAPITSRLKELRIGGPLSDGAVSGLTVILRRGTLEKLAVPGLSAAGQRALGSHLPRPTG